MASAKHPCDDCGESFFTKEWLRLHPCSHALGSTIESMDILVTTEPSTPDPVKFRCSTCGLTVYESGTTAISDMRACDSCWSTHLSGETPTKEGMSVKFCRGGQDCTCYDD